MRTFSQQSHLSCRDGLFNSASNFLFTSLLYYRRLISLLVFWACVLSLFVSNAQAQTSDFFLEDYSKSEALQALEFEIPAKTYFRPSGNFSFKNSRLKLQANLNFRSKNNEFIPYFFSAISTRPTGYVVGAGIENFYKSFALKMFYEAKFNFLDDYNERYDYTYKTGISAGYRGEGIVFQVTGSYGLSGINSVIESDGDQKEVLMARPITDVAVQLSSQLFYHQLGDIALKAFFATTLVHDFNDEVYSIGLSLPNTFGKTKWGYFFSNVLFSAIFENNSNYIFRSGYFQGIPDPSFLSSSGYIGRITYFDLQGEYVLRGSFGYVFFPFSNIENFKLKPVKGVFFAPSANVGWVHDAKREKYAHQIGYSLLGTIGYKMGSSNPVGFSLGWNNAYGLIVSFKALY